jgi:hypothetical protein
MRLLKGQIPGLFNGPSQSRKAHSDYSPPSSSVNITIWEGTQRLQSILQFCQQHNLERYTAPTVHPPILPTSQSRKVHSAYSPPSNSANITISEGTQRLKSTLQLCEHHNLGRHTMPTVHPPVLPTSQSRKAHSAYSPSSSATQRLFSDGSITWSFHFFKPRRNILLAVS